MRLKEILAAAGIKPEDIQQYMEYEIVAHEAGEKADEVVYAEVVTEVKTIYLEYE